MDRSGDRRITAAGLAVSAAFLALAGLALAIPGLSTTPWLPLHLVLAGAAGSAIGAVMPFFAAALVAAPPARAAWRIAVVALVAAGALGVSAGVAGGMRSVALAGAASFIGGMIALGIVTLGLLHGTLSPRRRIFGLIYGSAVTNVIVGASLATLFVAGSGDVAAAWGTLKPAHAWLNLFGFVVLVIAASLIHLYPTVLGTRIERGRAQYFALVGLAIAPPLVAAGFAFRADLVGRIGAAVMVAGALALGAHAVGAWRARGRWTTDPGWHRFAIGSLSFASAWLVAGVLIAASRVLLGGPSAASWSLLDIAAPLGAGCVVQVLIGSWTHLLPSVGPGDQRRHATQRAILGRLAASRLVAFQVGVVLLAWGSLAATPWLMLAGGVLVAVSAGTSLVWFGLAHGARRLT